MPSTRLAVRLTINREELQPSELSTASHAHKAFLMVVLIQDRNHRARQWLMTLMAQVPRRSIRTPRTTIELPIQVKMTLRQPVSAVRTTETIGMVLLIANFDVPTSTDSLPTGSTFVARVGLKALLADRKLALLEMVLYEGLRALGTAETLLVTAGSTYVNEIVGDRLFTH